MADSADQAVSSQVGDDLVKPSVAGVHAAVDDQASVVLHVTKLPPSAQRDPDPVSEPFRAEGLTKQSPLVLGEQCECVIQRVVGGTECVVAGEVGRIGERI